MDDVARALARVVRAVQHDRLDPRKGAVMVQALRVLLEALEQSEQQAKLMRALEDVIAQRDQLLEQLQRRQAS